MPVLIEKVKIPDQFSRIQTVDLTTWAGNDDDPGARNTAARDGPGEYALPRNYTQLAALLESETEPRVRGWLDQCIRSLQRWVEGLGFENSAKTFRQRICGIVSRRLRRQQNAAPLQLLFAG